MGAQKVPAVTGSLNNTVYVSDSQRVTSPCIPGRSGASVKPLADAENWTEFDSGARKP